MNIQKLLNGQPEADVRAAMAEEKCEDCFGCPHATPLAAAISSLAVETKDTVDATSDFFAGWFDDPEEKIGSVFRSTEQLQNRLRAELQELTAPCEGWCDGIGGPEVLRPAEMCNSLLSGDGKLAIAAGGVLEKLAKLGA